jgi:hypothetical protein
MAPRVWFEEGAGPTILCMEQPISDNIHGAASPILDGARVSLVRTVEARLIASTKVAFADRAHA